jgi:hypothetical protein
MLFTAMAGTDPVMRITLAGKLSPRHCRGRQKRAEPIWAGTVFVSAVAVNIGPQPLGAAELVGESRRNKVGRSLIDTFTLSDVIMSDEADHKID